jgi:hypothetical protein
MSSSPSSATLQRPQDKRAILIGLPQSGHFAFEISIAILTLWLKYNIKIKIIKYEIDYSYFLKRKKPEISAKCCYQVVFGPQPTSILAK